MMNAMCTALVPQAARTNVYLALEIFSERIILP